MTAQFDCFVVFAEMRTGSNFLESNINEFAGLRCYGETFNPYFLHDPARRLVDPKRNELFGMTREMRDADPLQLIERMKDGTTGLAGFRFFHDHDVRVFDAIIDDPRVAKVVLSRNLVEAYVSRKIAWETDQWKLGDMDTALSAQINFVPEEFEKLFNRMKAFQLKILRRLQATGQTAFYIDYEDIQSLDVINGLGRFLGQENPIEAFSTAFKKQNPEPLSDKVRNYDEMVEALGKIDHYDLQRIPNFETRRGAMVPSYFTAAKAPLLFMPIHGGPTTQVTTWMATLDNVNAAELGTGLNQKNLRQWKRKQGAHRSFTVLRHPVARLHAAYCRHFLTEGPDHYHDIAQSLRDVYKVPVPKKPGDASYDRRAHHEAFVKFAHWVKGNLGGQTSIRVDGAWATQSQTLQGFAHFILPDHVLREDQLATGLAGMCVELGLDAPELPEPEADTPFALAEIYDREVEDAVRGAYQRDYMMFGFGRWGQKA
jgi:LPS sulfotransferase NodH